MNSCSPSSALPGPDGHRRSLESSFHRGLRWHCEHARRSIGFSITTSCFADCSIHFVPGDGCTRSAAAARISLASKAVWMRWQSPQTSPLFLADFPSPWLYQSAEGAAKTLQRAGFVDIQTSLEAAPTLLDDRQHFSEFIKTVIVALISIVCQTQISANNISPLSPRRPPSTIHLSSWTIGV